MANLHVFTDEDIQNQHEKTLRLYQSWSDLIPFFGKPSKELCDLNRIYSKIQKEGMIDLEKPLDQLTMNELLVLLFKTLDKTKTKHALLSNTAHPCSGSVLNIMNELLPESGTTFRKSEIQATLKNIENLAKQIESSKSALNYGKAALKLMLVVAAIYAAQYCYYASIASLGLIAVTMLTGPLAFIAVGAAIALGTTLAGLGISAIGVSLRLVKSSLSDVMQTYAARNPSDEQDDSMDDQCGILMAIETKLEKALDKASENADNVSIKLD